MNKGEVLNLLDELLAKYVKDDWPKRRGVKIAKEVELTEPVQIDEHVVPAGTLAVFHPTQRTKRPYSAAIFYEAGGQAIIKSDGSVSWREIGKPAARPRPPKFF